MGRRPSMEAQGASGQGRRGAAQTRATYDSISSRRRIALPLPLIVSISCPIAQEAKRMHSMEPHLRAEEERREREAKLAAMPEWKRKLVEDKDGL